MKIAIHETNIKGFFSSRWIEYCSKNNIPFKIVNCYSTNIIENLYDCNALLWHISHAHPIDFQIGIKLIQALEAGGKYTFPNVNSCWHFDDKVSQKYLLEAMGAPLIKSWVFYNKADTFKWINETTFPKVFKLKGGAGSANVKLARNRKQARKFAKKSFGSGYRQFDRINLFKDAWRKFFNGSGSINYLVQEFLKIFVSSNYEKVKGKEKGYAYFQEFLPNNDSDSRIVVIGNKAFAIKRMTRENDFRASGSGQILYKREFIDRRCVEIAFQITSKLGANCMTFDFLFNTANEPLIAEISYGFFQDGYDPCPGYWDVEMKWHDGHFNPQAWMVDDVIGLIKKSVND